MKTLLDRGLMALLAVWLAAVACSISSVAPTATTGPILSQQDVAGTAAALVLTAQAPGAPLPQPQVPGGSPANPAACQPMVTANENANVRSGPSTDYDVVGSISQGGTAPVAGKNNSGTWWYLDYAGGHAWIASSVTTAACIPATLAVIAAPPLSGAAPAAAGQPDLIISEFSVSPATPTMGQPAHVRIGAYNQGNAASGPYTVQWWGLSTFASPSCTWNVDSSAAHGGRILECDFTFSSWYPVNKTSVAKVDTNSQVSESDESNNQGTISPFGVVQAAAPPAAGQPDLIVSEFTISPSTPKMGQPAHVRIGAYNQGNAASGPYSVQWWGLSTFASPSCSWNVDSSNAHGGRILECDFTFSSWYPINKTSLAKVDTNGQVAESNEGNNEATITPFGVDKP